MSDAYVAHVVRTLRIRHRWRQTDLARHARLSPWTVSRIERGHLDGTDIARLRRAVEALGGRLELVVKWQGGDLDRLVAARHSAMHERVAGRFDGLPEWQIAPEVSFSVYGERGVIDILAWHAATRSLLIVELKTEIVDINLLMGRADQRRRLAPGIAVGRGWEPRSVSVWVVVADSRTNRRRLAAHRSILRAAFPTDGRSVGAWLHHPTGPISALSFLSNGQRMTATTSIATPKRVRIATPRSVPPTRS